MNELYGNPEDKEFIAMLQRRAQTKANELTDLIHKRRQIELQIERTKDYVEELNRILEREGHTLVPIKEPPPMNAVGKPGNRAKGLPIRKVEWEGMTINEIVPKILEVTPERVYLPKELAPLVYEIQSESDLRMVLKNFRSMLQRGMKDGLWDKVGRGQYKAKIATEQRMTVNA